MDETVEVTIPVEPRVARLLADERNRAFAGRLLADILFPPTGSDPLVQAIAELKAEARAAGLTDEEIDAELAAYNAERRSGEAADCWTGR